MRQVISIILVLFIATLLFSSFQADSLSGQEIYKKKCQRCHCETGSKEKFGAKNLQISHMKWEDMIALISAGKKPMPSFKNKLSSDEITQVANYVVSLRNYK